MGHLSVARPLARRRASGAPAPRARMKGVQINVVVEPVALRWFVKLVLRIGSVTLLPMS